MNSMKHFGAFQQVPPRVFRVFLDKNVSFLKNFLRVLDLQNKRYGESRVPGAGRSASAENLQEIFGQNLELHRDMTSWPRENFEYLVNSFREDLNRLREEGLDLQLLPYFSLLLSSYGTPKNEALLALWPRKIEESLKLLSRFRPGVQIAGILGKVGESAKTLVRALDSSETVEKAHYAFKSFKKQMKDLGLDRFLRTVTIPSIKKSLSSLLSFVNMASERVDLLAVSGKEPVRSSKIETLYHASINAAELMRKGFSQKWSGEGGLGGSRGTKGDVSGVSFTYDLYVAKEIARSLKIATLIAHRQVKLHHVMDWARRSNLLKEVLREAQYHDFSGEDKPEEVMVLYGSYSKALDRSGKGYFPFFMGSPKRLMKTLSSVNPRNVGVVSCLIDMSDPDILYIQREREYRIPVRSIKSVEKLIS